MPAPSFWSWVRILLLAAVGATVGWAAIRHWGGALPGVAGAVLAGCGWLGAVTAQWICLRRDVPVVLELVAVETAETERGAAALWEFAPPVPPPLARREMLEDWAREVSPGERVPARIQETGFGTVAIVIGTPTLDGWRLPPPRPVWPVAAQLYAVTAFVALLAVAGIALSPSHEIGGVIIAARQEPCATGLGQEPWIVTVETLDASGNKLRLRLAHQEFLRLLPAEGRRALAAPGLLSGEERESLWALYLPIGKRVRLRQTRLGRHEAIFYVGPEP